MKKNIFAILVGIGSIWGSFAHAACAPHDIISERLNTHFNETRQLVGIASDDRIVEIYASNGGSWTLVVSKPGKKSCMIASGQNYSSGTMQLVKNTLNF